MEQLATANIFAHTALKCAVLYKLEYDVIKADFPELPLKLEAATGAGMRDYQQLSPFNAEVGLFRHLSEQDVRKVAATELQLGTKAQLHAWPDSPPVEP